MPFNVRDYGSEIVDFFEKNVWYLLGGSAIAGCTFGIFLSGHLGFKNDQEYEEKLINELRPLVEDVDEKPGYSPVDSKDLGRRLEGFGFEVPEAELIKLDDLSRSEIVTALRTYKLLPRLGAEDE